MRLPAAASTAVSAALALPTRAGTWLGAARSALYLTSGDPPLVLAILSRDATRLPCGLLLATATPQLPLAGLAPALADLAARPPLVGDGAIRWQGPGGEVVVAAVREWEPARPRPAAVDPNALALARSLLADVDPDAPAGCLAALGGRAADRDCGRVVRALLGRGSGLTPSGDDVLAGYLVGAGTFGVDATALREAALEAAPARTTALSAALLAHAARGECVDELARAAEALTGRGAAEPALRALAAIGHTSGGALAWGLMLAGERALCGQAGAAGAPGWRPARGAG